MKQRGNKPDNDRPGKVSIIMLLLAAFTYLDYTVSDVDDSLFQQHEFFAEAELQLDALSKSQVPLNLWMFFEQFAPVLTKKQRSHVIETRLEAVQDSPSSTLKTI